MNRQQLRDVILEELTSIAPDIDIESIDDSVHLREEYDLDSMDAFNLLAAIHKRLGIDIPEVEYAHMHCLDELLNYLEAKNTAQERTTD